MSTMKYYQLMETVGKYCAQYIIYVVCYICFKAVVKNYVATTDRSNNKLCFGQPIYIFHTNWQFAELKKIYIHGFSYSISYDRRFFGFYQTSLFTENRKMSESKRHWLVWKLLHWKIRENVFEWMKVFKMI